MPTPLISFLVLDYKKPIETNLCLSSIRQNAKFNHQIIYLDNGSNDDYPNQLFYNGLCDVIIRKKNGMGGGFGQTDLIRYCDSEYFIFIQNDQKLINEINENTLNYFILLLNNGYHCIDLNGDQSGKGIWTDRAHMMKTKVFNDLAPFPNGGPGLDHLVHNEEYLQTKFLQLDYKIAHINPIFFLDCGKYSIRQCGKKREGLLIHRPDTKEMWVINPLREKCIGYPPLNDSEFTDMLNGNWPVWLKDEIGRVPKAWENNIFKCW